MARGILASDPFVSIDREGVGELVRIGVERGRKTKAKLKVGICGEHGGDPASVRSACNLSGQQFGCRRKNCALGRQFAWKLPTPAPRN
jgi:pyruvate, orthophosphate dikinase